MMNIQQRIDVMKIAAGTASNTDEMLDSYNRIKKHLDDKIMTVVTAKPAAPAPKPMPKPMPKPVTVAASAPAPKPTENKGKK